MTTLFQKIPSPQRFAAVNSHTPPSSVRTRGRGERGEGEDKKMRMRRGGISWRCLSERFRVLPSVMSQRRAWPRPAIRHSPEERNTQDETGTGIKGHLRSSTFFFYFNIQESYTLQLLRDVCFIIPRYNSTKTVLPQFKYNHLTILGRSRGGNQLGSFPSQIQNYSCNVKIV